MFRWIATVRAVLRSAMFRRRTDRELEDELQFHLQQEIAERIKSGLDPDEARYAALRSMGAIGRRRDECRDVRGTRWLENLVLDFRYSLRSIRRSKGLALGVVLSMGLGLGATASIFSLVDFLVFQPLPLPETNRVVRITNSTPQSPFALFSYPEYDDYSKRSQSFSGILTY